jgi:hypothetical protein
MFWTAKTLLTESLEQPNPAKMNVPSRPAQFHCLELAVRLLARTRIKPRRDLRFR